MAWTGLATWAAHSLDTECITGGLVLSFDTSKKWLKDPNYYRFSSFFSATTQSARVFFPPRWKKPVQNLFFPGRFFPVFTMVFSTPWKKPTNTAWIRWLHSQLIKLKALLAKTLPLITVMWQIHWSLWVNISAAVTWVINGVKLPPSFCIWIHAHDAAVCSSHKIRIGPSWLLNETP